MIRTFATIQFDPALGWWSPAVFWYVAISVFVCLVFCGVVFVGGLIDLRFLLRSLDEEEIDVADDGRVIAEDQTSNDRPSSADE